MTSDDHIKTAARDWLLRLSLESPTAEDQVRFERWCQEDPRHMAAFRRFESIWQDSTALEELEPFAALPLARDPWWKRMGAGFSVHPVRWAGSAAVAVAAAAVGGWLLLSPVHYATGIAEVREIHLSDGSDVTLGARSSLDVSFCLNVRHVVLNSGVAFFSVAKTSSRPFIVRVGDKEVRVLGTQFEIRRDPDAMRVSVVEGAVELMQVSDSAVVAPQQTPEEARSTAGTSEPASITIPDGASFDPTILAPHEHILTAGQQVTATLAGAIPDAQVMSRGQPAAWRYGRLVYVDAPLKDIVADANRYSSAPIKLADDDVANIRVSVTYPSNRVEELVTVLSRSLSLEIEHPAAGGILLKQKERNK